MLVIPAIDLRSGRVVRLLQGDFTKEKLYSTEPAEIARQWQSKGAKFLHIVDLDGALTGEPKHLDIIEDIIKAVDIPVEVGGGLRTDDAVERVLRKKATRVIVGTRAYGDEEFVKRLVKKFKERIVVGIDAAGKDVIARGWTSNTFINSEELAKKIESLGVETIIYTNILKDGTLERPNLRLIEGMLDAVKIKVIISGGISSIDDIRDIKKLARPNLDGIIIGKALYEGVIDLGEAVRVAEGE